MRKIKTDLDKLFIIEHDICNDDRGLFLESYDKSKMLALGVEEDFVKDNISMSKHGVLRGLHMQKTHQQSKLIRVVKGLIYDVVVDLRFGSNSYGKWFSAYLDNIHGRSLYIPKGFAHGFLTLSSEAIVLYKTSDYYYPNEEITLLYNDPELDIHWHRINEMDIIMSDKDRSGLTLKEYEKSRCYYD